MFVVDLLGVVVRNVLKVGGLGGREVLFHRLMQRTLIPLESQHVITALIDDSLRQGSLATHGIDGHDAPVQVQQRQQLWDGGDRVRFLLGRFLSEHQPIGVHPGADPVQWIAVLRAIPRATGDFAIHRDHFTRALRPYPLGPTHKATPKAFRGQPGDDLGNTVMGRHTVSQGNESPQPLQLEPGPNSAIPSQPSAPLATAQMVRTRMSINAWSFLRSIRGSCNFEKCSMKLPIIGLSRKSPMTTYHSTVCKAFLMRLPWPCD